MNRGRIAALVAGFAIAAALAGSSAASAATLIGDYQFQGTRASSGPGPTLSDVGGVNAFQNDNVMGASRQVLAFPLGSGVRISPAGVGTGSYSVVTTFRMDDVSSYEKLLDQTNGTMDAGLYVDGGYLGYYYVTPPPPVDTSDPIVFADNVYATAAVVVTPPSESKIYVNGALQLTTSEGVTPFGDILRLFKDNDSGGATGEESAGAVSCIRLYSGGLSASEIASVGQSPTCGTVASPAAAPVPAAKKKCKKHKRKHRSAESAKKKKCKKKKKR